MCLAGRRLDQADRFFDIWQARPAVSMISTANG
jgi:hypothetical protein